MAKWDSKLGLFDSISLPLIHILLIRIVSLQTSVTVYQLLLFFFKFFKKCSFLRERASMSGSGAQREEIQKLKQALGSELSGQSPTRGSNSQTCEIMNRAKVWCLTDWATQAFLPSVIISFSHKTTPELVVNIEIFAEV